LEPKLRGVDTLDTHDPDPALREFRDQMRDRGLAERHGGEIEDDRSTDEKGRGASGPIL
jgi:hypothetical protein